MLIEGRLWQGLRESVSYVLVVGIHCGAKVPLCDVSSDEVITDVNVFGATVIECSV